MDDVDGVDDVSQDGRESQGRPAQVRPASVELGRGERVLPVSSVMMKGGREPMRTSTAGALAHVLASLASSDVEAAPAEGGKTQSA
ncbi:hypothetical protein [Kitasatospora herbaricolor]|uniref:hypothetical protein n=1 Tax=Kitasatospora herbaricolor TaxID=68217 RepID=UPI0036DAC638